MWFKMKKTVEDLIKELEVDAEAGASVKKQKITDDSVEELRGYFFFLKLAPLGCHLEDLY